MTQIPAVQIKLPVSNNLSSQNNKTLQLLFLAFYESWKINICADVCLSESLDSAKPELNMFIVAFFKVLLCSSGSAVKPRQWRNSMRHSYISMSWMSPLMICLVGGGLLEFEGVIRLKNGIWENIQVVYGSDWAPVLQIWALAATNSTGPSAALFVCVLCNVEEQKQVSQQWSAEFVLKVFRGSSDCSRPKLRSLSVKRLTSATWGRHEEKL